MNQLISVIIPFLNPGEWLSEAVDSVLNQTYTNWELLLVDDGSVEEDTNLAKEYALKHPRKIMYLEHEAHINRGLTASRNYGIRCSKGELIAFLDADDLWLPKKLENQVRLFEEYPDASMICEASRFWYSWINPMAADEHINIGADEGLYQPCDLTKRLYPIGEGQPPCPSGIIIKKEAFDRVGGFEESFCGVYQLYEDQAFLAKVYLSEQVYISNTANNQYRKRADSMSGAANDEKLYNKVRHFFFTWMANYIAAHPIKDEEVMNMLSSRMDQSVH